MENFLSTVPGIIISIGGIIAVAVVGVLYIVGLWKNKKDNADDRLIHLLQETVNEMEKKVNQQTLDIERLTKKVSDIERENETLVKVLQGRDEQTQTFYKEAFKAFELVETMNKNQTEFLSLLAKHFKITI